MNKNSKIFVAGHTGLVGGAITRNLQKRGYKNLIFSPFPEYDLINQATVEQFFSTHKPEFVFLAAAKVGGIIANNTYRAQFIYENLQIQNNIIHQSYIHGVKKLLFLGSSCIYPKFCGQPMREEYLLTGELEYTNEPYAIAKIAGIKMCESYNLQYKTNFISVMPTNLFGGGDNFDLENSHVLPALIRKMHLGKMLHENNREAICNDLNKRPIKNISGNAPWSVIVELLKSFGMEKNEAEVKITLWGTGTPRREFLYSDDLADACVFLMEKINFSDMCKFENNKEIKNTHINIGTGKDIQINELATLIKNIIDFNGTIVWDSTKPDGTPRKLLDVQKLESFGWKYNTKLSDGIETVYKNYLK